MCLVHTEPGSHPKPAGHRNARPVWNHRHSHSVFRARRGDPRNKRYRNSERFTNRYHPNARRTAFVAHLTA